MSMVDDIKRSASRISDPEQGVSQMATKFNEVARLGMNKFMNNVVQGNIEFTDVADLERLYKIWKDVNNVVTGDGEMGSGTLPELSMSQEQTLENKVNIHHFRSTDANGQEVDKATISLDDLSKLSKEDFSQMVTDRSHVLNDENEEYNES